MSEKHICSLKIESRTHLARHLLDASQMKRIRFEVFQFFMASKHHPDTSRYLKSNYEIRKENMKLLEEDSFLLIHPLSIFKKYWDIFIFVILLLHTALTAFAVGFHIQLMESNTHKIYEIVDDFLCVILLMDFILKFRTALIIEKTHHIEYNTRNIFKHNIKFAILDILGFLPLVNLTSNLFPLEDFNNHSFITTYLLYITAIYCFHLYRLGIIERYFSKVISSFDLSEKKIMFIMLIFRTLFLWHLTASLRSPFDVKSRETSTKDFEIDIIENSFKTPSFTMRAFRPKFTKKQLIASDNLEDIKDEKNVSSKFITSMLITIKTALHSGYTENKGFTPIRNLITSLIIIFGWIYFTYVVIIILNLIFSDEISRNEYEEMSREIDAFCQSKGLSDDLTERTKKYFRYKYKGHYFEDQTIQNSTTENLRREILVYSCSSLFSRVSLFNQMPEDMLENIMSYLKLEVYFENDVIIEAGSAGDAMFFILSGSVAVFTPNGTERAHLSDGDYFGEISLVKNINRTATVIALETCEIYRLSDVDFQKVISPGSDIWHQIDQLASDRMRINLDREVL